MAETEKIDLERLPLSRAAWLVGLSTNALRARDVNGRRADGTYNGRSLVAALRREFDPAVLPPDLIEAVRWNLAEPLADRCLPASTAVLALLAKISQQHGPAGLAAAMEILSTEIAEFADRFGGGDRQLRKVVYRCPDCSRHRWGNGWKGGSPPPGYSTAGWTCEECEAKSTSKGKGKRRRRDDPTRELSLDEMKSYAADPRNCEECVAGRPCDFHPGGIPA